MRSRAPGEKIKLRPDGEIRRVVLCSGKVYYDLYEAREAAGIDDVYLMRVEQLLSVPGAALISELSRFPKAEVVWAQEEPQATWAPGASSSPTSSGCCSTRGAKCTRPRYVGRPASAATATGLASKHNQEQKALVEQALSPADGVQAMAIEIMVPALGESVTEATVGQWFKKPGEAVEVDEPLVELETDKVTVEVPAPAAGVLADIKVAQGATVAVGSVLGSISEGAGVARIETAGERRRLPRSRRRRRSAPGRQPRPAAAPSEHAAAHPRPAS